MANPRQDTGDVFIAISLQLVPNCTAGIHILSCNLGQLVGSLHNDTIKQIVSNERK
jgi:hypothetical protein